jgi:hypothetical protein
VAAVIAVPENPSNLTRMALTQDGWKPASSNGVTVHLKSSAREWLAVRRVQTLLPGIGLVAIPCFSVLQNTPVRTRASTSACVPPLLVVSEDRPALGSLTDRCQGVAVGDGGR